MLNIYSFFAIALLGPSLGLLVFSILILFLERKLIGIAQKRLGISFLGRNGWAHLPADLIKFWLKQTSRHHGRWNTSRAGITGVLLSYLCWNLISALFFLSDNGNSVSDFWDFQLLAYFAYAGLSSLFMFTIVAGSKSKYATLAASRVLLVIISMEVFFIISFLLVYTHTGSYSLEGVLTASSQSGGLLLALPPIACLYIVYILFEAKRAPFDHSEAESELVAGHLVEFGGRSLLFFYICEYIHLSFGLFFLICLLFGLGLNWTWFSCWFYFLDLLGPSLWGL